ncbi:MAG: serine/threonine-protein kinase [Candidatus Obscuribacterales bacterium]
MIDPEELIAEPNAPDLVDKLIDGKYRVVRLLGCGGLAAVYEAIHEELGRRVAIKALLPKWATETHQIKRFRREAQLLSEISHPGIAAVHACGMTADGQLYLCLEFVDGTALDDFLKKGNRLTSAQCCSLFLTLGSAVAFAHERGIIHRDIKPQNIMIAVDETSGSITAKLLDFGIGKIFSDEVGQKLTATGAVIGSPAYMSPEQFSGSTVDTRSDIYSFGCVLYETLTGCAPFQAESAFEMMDLHISQAPKPIPPSSSSPPGDPARDSLAQVALKCLAKKPDERFASMTEVCQALQQIQDAPTIPLRFRKPTASIAKPTTARSQRRFPLAAVIAVGIGAAALAAFLLLQKQTPPLDPRVEVFSDDERQGNNAYDRGVVEPDAGRRKDLMRQAAARIRRLLASSPENKLNTARELVLARCLREMPEDPHALKESRALFNKALQLAIENRHLVKESNARHDVANTVSDCYLNLGIIDIMENKLDDARRNFENCRQEQLAGGSEGDWGPLWGLELVYRFKRQPQEAKKYALLNAQMFHLRSLDDNLRGMMLADAVFDIKEADKCTLEAATAIVRKLVGAPTASEHRDLRNQAALNYMDKVLDGVEDAENAHAYEVDSRMLFRIPHPPNLR